MKTHCYHNFQVLFIAANRVEPRNRWKRKECWLTILSFFSLNCAKIYFPNQGMLIRSLPIMKLFLLCLLFKFAVEDSNAETVSIKPPDLTRKNPGDNCKIQWIVTGTFLNYTISFLGNNNQQTLGANKNSEYNAANGVITLFIKNVQLQDAGYYVLTLSTGTQQQQLNSIATLFVYGIIYSAVTNPSGKTQLIEGDIVELTCLATSYSSPLASQPNLQYFWQTSYNPTLLNISNGPAMTTAGDPVAGYSFKNNSQILVMNTSQILLPVSYVFCQTREEGSIYTSTFSSYGVFTLTRRPLAYSFSPVSKKYNFISTGGYTFQFNYNSNPILSSYSNCSFVNTSGYQQDIIPLQSFTNSYISFYVPLNNPRSYGNYTVTLSNSFGSTAVTFQALPSGVPDAPNDCKVRYLTRNVVSLQWRCGWYNGGTQTVTIRLRDVAKNSEVETFNTSLVANPQCYNSLFSTTFQRNLYPDTDYEASIWSSNTFGQSGVIALRVRTTSIPYFSVTCNNISISDSTALISVTTPLTGVWLNVTYCIEVIAQCFTQSYTLLTTNNQIVMESLPPAATYVFDFLLFNISYTYAYNLAIIKGLRISPLTGCNSTGCPYGDPGLQPCTDPSVQFCNSTSYSDSGEKERSLLIAVIVLSVLLGVALLGFIIILIDYARQRRHSSKTQISQQRPVNLTAQPSRRTNQRESEMNEYENYEGIMRKDEAADEYYTKIDNDSPPRKPPKIPMK